MAQAGPGSGNWGERQGDSGILKHFDKFSFRSDYRNKREAESLSEKLIFGQETKLQG